MASLWFVLGGHSGRGNKTMAPAPSRRQRRSSCESAAIRPADDPGESVWWQPGRRLQLDLLDGFDLLVGDMHAGEFADQPPMLIEPGADGSHAVDHPATGGLCHVIVTAQQFKGH